LEQLEKKPILKIEMTVKTNTIKRQTDKADVFGINMKSDQGTLQIGMKEATANLTIKSADDILHFNFPTDDEFVVLIYPKRRSEREPQDHTQQTAFSTEHTDKVLNEISPSAKVVSVHQATREPEPLQQADAFAEVPEEHEETLEAEPPSTS